jgi:hypothetical protein
VAIQNAQQAAANAETGLRFGIEQLDPLANWRSIHTHGDWVTNRSTGKGTFDLKGFDEIDSNIADDSLDPVVLVSTGRFRNSLDTVDVTVIPAKESLNCLQFDVVAGGDINVNSATIHCSGRIAANSNITAVTPSVVWPKCEAAGSIIGSGYQRTKTESITPLALPNATQVVTHYASFAQSIDFASLPTQTPNLIRDPGIEAGVGLWTRSWEPANTANLQPTATEAHSGPSSLSVDTRALATDGPAYYLTHIVKPNATYNVACWVKLVSAGPVRLALNTRVNGVDSWTHSTYTSATTAWTLVTATLVAPAYSGELEHAMLRIETDPGGTDPLTDMFVDDVSVVEVGTTRRLTHAVVGPDTNPFGTGSPEATYVIDCGNQDLQIEHCRIVGTLVIQNPGTVVVGPGPVSWQPAAAHHPSLIVDGDIQLRAHARGLNEYLDVVNYNPPGLPFEHIGTNSAQEDIFPSGIGGIVYSTANTTLGGGIHLRRGQILSADDVTVDGDVYINGSRAALVTPPPEFFRYRYQIFSAGNR